VKQQSISSGNVNGTYDVLDTSEDEMYTVTVSGTSASTPDGIITLQYNCPWTGFVCEVGGYEGIYLMTTDGIFFGGYEYGSSSAILAGIKE